MRLVFFMLCMIFSLFLEAQNILVSGRVVASESEEFISGAIIYDKLSGESISTDNSGDFSLLVSDSSGLLEVSYFGYKTVKFLPFTDNNDLIKLTRLVLDLEEVVVTALNLKREFKSLGYAISELESDQVNVVKSMNFVDQLAGKVSGVQVSHGASGVGSSSKITIRGEASFTNNDPLFVVDGTPINNNTNLNFTNAAAAGFQEVDFGNGAMEINADDIEKVTILKGPSAAALYGTRASNGVILITTKNAKSGKQHEIEFTSSIFIEGPFSLPEFQNVFGQGNSGEFRFIDGLGAGVNDNISYSWGPRLDLGLQIQQFDSPVDIGNGQLVRGGDVAVHGGAPISASEFKAHPDNLRNFYETGISSVNNLSVAASTNIINYRLSFTDLRSKSFIPGVNLNRKTVFGRASLNLSEKLEVSTTLQYVNGQSDNRPSSGYGSENINYSLVAWGPRSLNTVSLKTYWQPGLEDLQQYSFNYTFFDNPYFILLENRNSFNRNRIFGNIFAKYEISPSLKVSGGSGLDQSSELRKYRRHFSTNRFRNGAYAEQSVEYRENNSFLHVDYERRLGKVKTNLTLGASRMDQDAQNTQTQTLSLAQAGKFSFANAASPIEVFQTSARKRINSFYGLLKFDLADFIFLELTGRKDWSSSLATPLSTSNTGFFYPSISTSIVLSEKFELPNWISFAKLRMNWAQVGNDTDPYQTSRAFVSSTPFGSEPTFTSSSVIPNSELLPEQVSAFEIGGDLRLFDDNLKIDVSYYESTSENQIISFPVVGSSGYNEEVVNGGLIRSTGLEIDLQINPIRRQDFNWTSSFSFATNKSRVESLPEGADKVTLAFSRVYDNLNQTVWFQVEEGGLIGDMYGTGYKKNELNQFVLDDGGNFIADNNLVKLGNYNPDFTLGFANHFEIASWSLDVLLDWRNGGQLVSRTLSLAGVGGQLIETANRPEEGIIADGVINVGTEEEPEWSENVNAISAESYYRQYYDRNHEVNSVYNASFLKLREVAIGYKFNSKDSGFFTDGRYLSISMVGRNLLAISEIPHFDPEQLALQGNKFISGVEDMSYPSARSIGLKISLGF